MITRENAPAAPPSQAVRRAQCRRCGRGKHVIEDDGPAVCRICVFAWGSFARSLRAGVIVPEVGGMELRHVSHESPMLSCPLCRADQVRAAASFDGWVRRRTT